MYLLYNIYINSLFFCPHTNCIGPAIVAPQKEKKVEKFIFGLALGMAGGALIVANNCKLLNLVKKNQEDLMKKAENYIDTKLEEMEKKVETEEE